MTYLQILAMTVLCLLGCFVYIFLMFIGVVLMLRKSTKHPFVSVLALILWISVLTSLVAYIAEAVTP